MKLDRSLEEREIPVPSLRQLVVNEDQLNWLAEYQPQILALLVAVAESSEYPDIGDLPTLSLVATTGQYGDLSGKPTLGTASSESTDFWARRFALKDI